MKSPTYSPINRFRKKRGRALREQIESLVALYGRDIRILDVGGRPDYWANVGLEGIERIDLVNIDEGELGRAYSGDAPEGLFQHRIGDACDLRDYADQSVDLVHSNSVIEHVGGWRTMQAMAEEMMRVGRSGWMQTPAWEFPVEPHHRMPFGHWFGKPAQAWSMSFSFDARIRRYDRDRRRREVEKINLLSRGEVRDLFPGRPLKVERVVFAKSYVIHWMPEATAAVLPEPEPAAKDPAAGEPFLGHTAA